MINLAEIYERIVTRLTENDEADAHQQAAAAIELIQEIEEKEKVMK